MIFQISDRPVYSTISDSIGEFYDLIAGNHNVFPTRQQIYNIQTRLWQEEHTDAIQYLMNIITN